MSFRLRAALALLAFLVLANIGWRVWANWGLITIDVDRAPVSQVVKSITKQAGITLVSNAPADATVTMHVHRVPLVRALQVLSINTGGNWSVGYVLAPNKTEIRGLLDAFANGGDLTPWKTFSLPAAGLPGGGASDPREDSWAVTAPAEAKLQPYLEQGSQFVNAQFWAPQDWNPPIAKAPAAGAPAKVTRKLAAAAGGESREVFFLTMPVATADGQPGRPPGGGPPGGGPPGGFPDAATAKAMGLREQARIDRLPAAQRKEAQAKFDARKKFFTEMMQLPPEERRARMQERIEEDMRSSGPTPFEQRMTQFDAMHTVEQRSNFYRMVLKFKQGAGAAK